MAKNILVTYAVKGEMVDFKGTDDEFYYLFTGIGKMKSTYYLSNFIHQFVPDLVLNIGSAGTAVHQIGDVFVCHRFIDRDMRKLANIGIESEIDTSALLNRYGFGSSWMNDGICNTGDSFVTEHSNLEGDVIDMEAYAQAFVCRTMEVPFVSIKYVTDIIGHNSVNSWEEKLVDAQKGLTEFFEKNHVY
ncbi:MAG: nucleosidase [Bacteroidaceae bacterium]|nr:nucleosidase [Bacteroidaceae bacterium]